MVSSKEYFKQRYRDNPEDQKLRSKKSYEKNKAKVLLRMRGRHLEKTYGISIEDYNLMVIKQHNKCAICGNTETATTRTGEIRPLAVDHCHTTGIIRALLCNNCNLILGHAKDNQMILLKSVEYLKNFQPDNMRGGS